MSYNLSILGTGQYQILFPLSHFLEEETVQMSIILKVKKNQGLNHSLLISRSTDQTQSPNSTQLVIPSSNGKHSKNVSEQKR